MDSVMKINWGRTLGYAGLVSLGFVIAFGLIGLIGPVTFGKDAPAWVQAVGSIFAILVAVGVAYWQRRQEIRDRRDHEFLVARSFGLALLRELEKMEARIDRDIAEIERAPHNDMIGICKDTIPQALWDKAESLHLLGPAGSVAISAIHAIHRARSHTNGNYVYREDMPDYLRCMKEAKGFCQAAVFHVSLGL